MHHAAIRKRNCRSCADARAAGKDSRNFGEAFFAVLRKRTIRSQDEQRAAERRVLFGMPKAERLLMKTRAEKARQDLEGHRVEDGEGR